MRATSPKRLLSVSGLVVLSLLPRAPEAGAQRRSARPPTYPVRGKVAGCGTVRVNPVLPPGAASAEGDPIVILEVESDGAGVPKAVRFVSGQPSLARAAIEAVRRWRFEPGAPQKTLVGMNLLSRPWDRKSRPPTEAVPPAFPVPIRFSNRSRYPLDSSGHPIEGSVHVDTVIDPRGMVANVCAPTPAGPLSEYAVGAALDTWFQLPPGMAGRYVRVVCIYGNTKEVRRP